MRFIDEAQITVHGGPGGDGCTSFLREKYRPYGGPDGGDGGDGGSIIFEADANLSTLQDFRFRKEFHGKAGTNGKGKNQHGRAALDTIVRVPVGTVVRDAATGELLADFTKVGERVCLAKGGAGGKGNPRFTTRANRIPTEHDDGHPGEERTVDLELKLLADVGLIGLPNAGKSTLLANISAARPKIADYPFTTLSPVLGIATGPNDQSFTVADIPGLIEGAHAGHGLGIQFLRHLSRTKVLVHLVSLIDGGGVPYPPEELCVHYESVRSELVAFGQGLEQKPEFLVFTKTDSCRDTAHLDAIRREFKDKDIHFISAPLKEGLPELLQTIAGAITKPIAKTIG